MHKLYYGTEIGMEGCRDPDNRRDMPWSLFGPDNRPTEEHPFERDIFDHVANMVKLRADNASLRYGYLFTLYVDQFLYAYLREFRSNVVLVVINNGREPMPLPASIEIAANSNIPPRIKRLLTDGQALTSPLDELGDVTIGSGRVEVQLPGKTAGIYIL